MDEKEKLRELIDNPKMPTVSEWVYEVEAFLDEVRENDTEAWTLIDGIKLQGDKLIGVRILQLCFVNYTNESMIKWRQNRLKSPIKSLWR